MAFILRIFAQFSYAYTRTHHFFPILIYILDRSIENRRSLKFERKRISISNANFTQNVTHKGSSKILKKEKKSKFNLLYHLILSLHREGMTFYRRISSLFDMKLKTPINC